MSDQNYLDGLRAAADSAERDLYEAVASECSGRHKVVQHRDGLPPWCRSCGRTGRGVRVKEVDQ